MGSREIHKDSSMVTENVILEWFVAALRHCWQKTLVKEAVVQYPGASIERSKFAHQMSTSDDVIKLTLTDEPSETIGRFTQFFIEVSSHNHCISPFLAFFYEIDKVI
jgi:hypothetical protein